MTDQLQRVTRVDQMWFSVQPTAAFRFRRASEAEARAAGVQNPHAQAVCVRACSEQFLIVSSGTELADKAIVRRLCHALGADEASAIELTSNLSRVRPETLAFAAARLMRSAAARTERIGSPQCSGCRCGLAWTGFFAALADDRTPAGSAGRIEMESAWTALRDRTGGDPPSDAGRAAGAALREFSRSVE